MTQTTPHTQPSSARLFSKDALSAYEKIATRHKLLPEWQPIIFRLLASMTDHSHGPRLSTRLRRRLRLDPATAIVLARELEEVFLNTPAPVALSGPSAEQVIASFLKAQGVESTPKTSAEFRRLATFLRQYLLEEHTRKEILAMAMRPTKVGGLNAVEGDMSTLLDQLDQMKEALGFTKQDSAQNGSDVPEPEPEAPEVLDAFSDDDAQEIEAVKKRSKALEQTFAAVSSNIESTVTTVLDQVSRTDKAFREVVVDRIKGKLDPYQAREKFEAQAISGAELARVMEVVEEAVNAWKQTHKPAATGTGEINSAQKEVVEAARMRRMQQLQPAYSKDSAMPSGQPPRVDPVISRTRLSGPLDELSSLSVVAFRRLSHDPIVAMKKIQDKIDLFAQDGLDKRVEAIRAWQRSPMYHTYLSLTKESLQSGQSLAQVAQERAQKNPLELSKDEVNAMIELNKQLRF